MNAPGSHTEPLTRSDIMSATEVADLLGIARPTVYAWAAEGRLPSVPLSPRKIVFRRSSIAAWLAERERAAREP